MKILISSAILLLLNSQFSFSQLKDGDNLLGVSIGFWPANNSPVIGANFESQLTQAGVGTLAWVLSLDITASVYPTAMAIQGVTAFHPLAFRVIIILTGLATENLCPS